MKKHLIITALLISLVSCSTQGVEKPKENKNNSEQPITRTARKSNKVIDADKRQVKSTESYDNGIVISWIEHGKGDSVKKGDVVNIDYKVNLQDGKVIDGNHIMRQPFFPFVVGFQMQTKGWDFVFEKLRVGDYVRIKIPSELARGEQGIKKEGESGWFVPPNSMNYVTVHILEKRQPTREVDGVKVWVFEENKENKLTFNTKNAVIFHCMISSESNPIYYNSYQKNTPYKLLYSDKGIVPGLKKALINAKKADRMFVTVPSSEAFGTKGSEGFVKPNEDLFYNILVMDVVTK